MLLRARDVLYDGVSPMYSPILASLVLLAWLAPFSPRQRRRFSERAALLRWHLAGCPADAGLSRAVPAREVAP